MTVKPQSANAATFLDLPGERRIAYALSEGKLPGIAFLGGFKSDMGGAKAMALEAFARAREQRFLRFDYTGHGQSSGMFEHGTIGQWKRDALDMLDALMPDETLLVGSSMGGWIMLLAALERKERVKGLVSIAGAPDFTENLIWKQLNAAQKRQMEEEGAIHLPSCHGQEPYPITRGLIEEARNHLLLDAPIPLFMPVRLIHGMRDEDVPWRTSLALMERLGSPDVALTLVKEGNHRLSEPGELELLCGVVKELLALY